MRISTQIRFIYNHRKCVVGACGAKVQMIKYTGGSPQQSRDGGLTGSLGTKKKILGVISFVVVFSLMIL